MSNQAEQLDPPAQCEWFILCEQPPKGLVAHPVLGAVPTCEGCANKLGLEFLGGEKLSDVLHYTIEVEFAEGVSQGQWNQVNDAMTGAARDMDGVVSVTSDAGKLIP